MGECTKEQLQKELDETMSEIAALDSPLVFCHNELNPSNIILSQDKGNQVC